MDTARNSPHVAVEIAPHSTNGSANSSGTLPQASSSTLIRQPTVVFRESAAQEPGARRGSWLTLYSPLIVAFYVILNSASLVAAVAVLILSREERPHKPLRAWVVVYTIHCLLYILCVCWEWRRLRHHRINANQGIFQPSRMAKCLLVVNAIVYYPWSSVGFYWIISGGEALKHDAPQLYWLCVVFVAIYAVFVGFYVTCAGIIGIALCCCLPCIMVALWLSDRPDGGASRKDIKSLPKHKFLRTGARDQSQGGVMSLVGPTEGANERVLSVEDAKCCICVSAYDDGVKLRELPCTHHFHRTCIDKWLLINATCPLCKCSIGKGKGNGNGREGV